LCHAPSVGAFHRDALRAYFRCGRCALVFADPAAHLPPDEEKARYDLHEYDPSDPAYRKFLSRLAQPLLARLDAPPLDGLDFGCGPGPTLSVMLEERGYSMALYDPFFAPDPSVLERAYDFVTCTEVVEHFRRPADDWRRLLGLVKPGGWLGVMTKLAPGADAFADWHYIRDPTHVSFFSRATFRYLARRDGLALELVSDDVILLRKP